VFKLGKKIYVIGLDAASPKLVKMFAKKGSCQNFRKLMKMGGFSKALPAVPAQTPENWTTIATGAWPGTHGIAVWGRHDPGETITEKHGDEAMSSNLCKAEYFWEAAARQGRKTVLFNFIGYPPTSKKVIHVDWFFMPGAYYFEIARAVSYANFMPEPPFDPSPGVVKKSMSHVEFERAKGWRNLPKGDPEPLEARIEVAPNTGDESITYYVLLLGRSGKYRTCAISRIKDYSKILIELKPGQWSPWFKEVFTIDDQRREGTIRFKLVELSPDAARFRLYRSQVYPTSGFSHPPEVSGELVQKFGPYVNEAVTYLYFAGLVDERTWIEELEYQINWIINAAGYLMNKYNATVFFLHWHLLDALQHKVLGYADPSGGKYDPSLAKRAWRTLELGYKLADELIGGFMKLLDNETYLVVVSDHGNAPNRKKFSILRALAERGLVHIVKKERGFQVDWTKSKVFVDLTNVYVNLRSRYKGGVVDDSEYEEVRKQVIDALRSCKDEEGEYAVAFALKREDAAMIGLWGEHVGDVVFAYSPGFTWGVDGIWEGSQKAGGANHGPQIPTAETHYSSNYAIFIIAGPGIKKGYERNVDFLGPVLLVDIAPTMAYLLGILPPRHTQGRILYDFLEGWDASEMKRRRVPLKIPIVRRKLKGDVTDQM